MKLENVFSSFWNVCYVIFMSLIVANYWVGFYMGAISPLPLMPGLTYLIAPICGALLYLFLKSVRGAFYATLAMCTLSCIITAVALFMPALLGIVDMEISFYISLRIAIQMFIYVFPFAIGGCFVTAYVFPD